MSPGEIHGARRCVREQIGDGAALDATRRADRWSSCHRRGCAQESSNRLRAAATRGAPAAPGAVAGARRCCLPCGRPASSASQPCPRRPRRRYRDALAHADSVTGSSPLSPSCQIQSCGHIPSRSSDGVEGSTLVELGQAELPVTGRAGSCLRTELTGVQCEAPCDRAWELADGVGGGWAIPTARGRVQELLPSRRAHERGALTSSCFGIF
jgi:hypothetical protein